MPETLELKYHYMYPMDYYVGYVQLQETKYINGLPACAQI
jgi:hypothetical protein